MGPTQKSEPASGTILSIRCCLVMLLVLVHPCLGRQYLSTAPPWDSLAPGLEIAFFKGSWDTPVSDTTITILRIDPAQWELRFLCLSELDADNSLTARQWCERHDLVAATNAGMFAGDFRTHVGYMKSGDHVNNAKANHYQSAVAFGPIVADQPYLRVFDLDTVDLGTIKQKYGNIAQNLRLIKRPGINRWSAQSKIWSEAALGEDSAGRLLFIFTSSPFSMHDLNGILLSLPIDLVCAQHLEGGPEAQLYVRYGDTEYEFFGSYETGFRESAGNEHGWPIPNAIGIVRREPNLE